MIRDVEPESDPIRLPVVSDKGGYDPHCLGLHSSTRDPFAYLAARDVIELSGEFQSLQREIKPAPQSDLNRHLN